jgi:hypothetical protein
MRKNEILSFAIKWTELKNIILSKITQAQKTKNHIFSLLCRLLIWAKAVMLLDFGHTLWGEHIWEEWG